MNVLSLPTLQQLALAHFQCQIVRDNALVPLKTRAYQLLPTGGIVAVESMDPVVPRQILVANLSLTKKRLGREAFSPDEYVNMTYRTLPRVTRGMMKGGRRIEEVELPLVTSSQRFIHSYFNRCLFMDSNSTEQVAEFESDVLELAEALADGDLETIRNDPRVGQNNEPPRNKAARMLDSVSVTDVLDRPNLRRLPLKFASADAALQKDERRLRGTSVVLDARAAACAHMMDECVGMAEGCRQVAVQAITAPYMRSLNVSPKLLKRKENAIRYWRDQAETMNTVVFMPFSGFFHAAAVAFLQAADAVEKDDLIGGQQAFFMADAVLSLVRVSADLSQILLNVWPFVDERINRTATNEDGNTLKTEIELLHASMGREYRLLPHESLVAQGVGIAHLRLVECKPSAHISVRALNATLHTLERELEDIGEQLLLS